MYTGSIANPEPTPRPTKKRPIIRVAKERALDWILTPMMKIAAARMKAPIATTRAAETLVYITA